VREIGTSALGFFVRRDHGVWLFKALRLASYRSVQCAGGCVSRCLVIVPRWTGIVVSKMRSRTWVRVPH